VNGTRKGIAVDSIQGKIQAVLKPLGEHYQNQEFISGSTILGDGTIALVLDPQRLFNT
jgi:two-component system chemotaxis sensor kinase CheA